ncbi:MAG: type II toxin-antitoxin system RelE/ParE family toxin [Acidobacteria bacterium]|nr:type II toxin-antitoxin system RelE/ParE family toxin [Acidobacteriota bacterium]
MAREVDWTDPGWEDLEAAASLAEFAERGQTVPEFADESIREFLVKPYRLIYKVTEEHVFIVAFIHGARRLWRI